MRTRANRRKKSSSPWKSRHICHEKSEVGQHVGAEVEGTIVVKSANELSILALGATMALAIVKASDCPVFASRNATIE
jgi:hypothetical protein